MNIITMVLVYITLYLGRKSHKVTNIQTTILYYTKGMHTLSKMHATMMLNYTVTIFHHLHSSEVLVYISKSQYLLAVVP